MSWRPFVPFVVLAALSTACSDDTATTPQDPVDTSSVPTTAPEDQTQIPVEPQPTYAPTLDQRPLVDVDWLDDEANEYVVVDTRSLTEYLTGHIPGARNLPAAGFNDRADETPYQLGSADAAAALLSTTGIGPDDTLVLYDNEGSLNAARVYYALTYYGHEDLRILDGGLGTWLAADRSESVEPPTDFEALDYPVQPVREELRLELLDVSAAIEQGTTTFADARTTGEFDGSVSFDTELDGHIPGARNVDYAETIGADGRFLPADELRDLYTSAGIGPDSEVVTYCLVGARGAHSWFVLSELLEYPAVALYDGSWTEYGNTPGVEVET